MSKVKTTDTTPDPQDDSTDTVPAAASPSPDTDYGRLCLALDWVHNLMDNARVATEALESIPASVLETLPEETQRSIDAAVTVLSFWEPPHLLQVKGRF